MHETEALILAEMKKAHAGEPPDLFEDWMEFGFLGPEASAAADFSAEKKAELERRMGGSERLSGAAFVQDWCLFHGFLAGVRWERERTARKDGSDGNV